MINHAHRSRPRLDVNGIFCRETYHLEPLDMPCHAHEGAEMALILDGYVEKKSVGTPEMVGPLAFAVNAPGVPHSCQYGDSVHAFYIAITPLAWTRITEGINRIDPDQVFRNSPESTLALQIFREYRNQDSLASLSVEALISELMLSLSTTFVAPEEGTIPGWLKQTRDFLHDGWMDKISVDDLSYVACVHPGHLMREWRRHFRCTIGQYLRRLKIEHAYRMIAEAEPTQSLGEISANLGFYDQSQFCRTFKHFTGQTPAQARCKR